MGSSVILYAIGEPLFHLGRFWLRANETNLEFL